MTSSCGTFSVGGNLPARVFIPPLIFFCLNHFSASLNYYPLWINRLPNLKIWTITLLIERWQVSHAPCSPLRYPQKS